MSLNKILNSAALSFIAVAMGCGGTPISSQPAETKSPSHTAVFSIPTSVGTNDESPKATEVSNAANKVDVASELDKLSGVWVCIGYERDGEEHVDKRARNAMWNETLWFRSGPPADSPLNLSWELDGKQTSAAAVFTLHPATISYSMDLKWRSIPARKYMPKGIDSDWEQATWNETKPDSSQPGVYSIDGERLRIGWGKLGGDRPTILETEKRGERTVRLYEKKQK